jgi:NAD(P)-dependent dehydrogenase (short-subunit alcohol dehydrogenase family)
MQPILRPGLLDGVTVLLDGVGPTSELEGGLGALGAFVSPLPEGAVPDSSDALVLDFTGWVPDGPGVGPLQELLDRAWSATEAVANGAFIPAGAGGRILFLAPGQPSAPTVSAAVAALENLSRTLSVEWARYGITVNTVAPGPDTSPEDLTAFVAFLLSAAGGYFSGARLDLDPLAR